MNSVFMNPIFVYMNRCIANDIQYLFLLLLKYYILKVYSNKKHWISMAVSTISILILFLSRYWCTKCSTRFSSQSALVDHMSYSVEHNYTNK